MLRKLYILPVLALILAGSVGVVSAASLETYADGNSGRVYAIRVTPPRLDASAPRAIPTAASLKATADDFIAQNLLLIGITNPTEELQAATPETDQLGLSRVHYFQRWHGLDVLGGEITVHLNKDGQIYYVKTKVAKDLPGDTSPSVTRDAAEKTALDLALANGNGTATLTVASSKLLVLPLGIVRNEPAGQTRLAWEVRVVDADTNGDHFGEDDYFDAVTGALLLQLPLQRHYTAVTREVYDCASGAGANTCLLNAADPTYPAYIHGRSEGDPARGPFPNPAFPLFYGSSEVDSLYGYLKSIHDYYSTTFGIDGANGHGGLADWPSVPQHITRGVAHNDGYNGAPCPGFASFSNSTGTIFFCRGMVVPDVVAHEYTHGIVQHSFHDVSGFPIGEIYSGQTASLNEATADVMGQVFENAYTGMTDWINGIGTGHNLRDLANPHAFTRVGFDSLPYPDRWYDPSVYCGGGDSGGAHHNMTVPAHAIYLFSEGGTRNGCTIQGQGIDVAQRVLFRGWRTYFSRSVSFNEAYTDLIQACTDLYPASVTAELTKALQAVEMDQPGLCSGIPEAPVPCAVSGVAVVPGPAAASLRILSANPTKDAARFSYFTSRPGRVEVRVHDLMGRVVARPVDEYHLAGEQIGAWDGRLPSGEQAPGGIYFVSVALDRKVLGTAKLVVVR